MRKNRKASKIAEYPLLMAEWCFEKNIEHGFDPWKIGAHSKVKPFWVCPVCGNIYRAGCGNRQTGTGCNGKCLDKRLHDAAMRRAQKTRQMCIEKYGVVNLFQLESVKEKSKKTCLAKYGTPNATQNEAVREKREATCLKRYGVKNPLQNKTIKAKQEQTFTERYGASNPSQIEEFQNKKIETSFKRFGKRHHFCKDEHLKGDRADYYRKYKGEFNNSLKEFIKARDGHKCQYPGCDNVSDLCVHHIDNVKSNNDPSNLVTVCRSCHSHITVSFPHDEQKYIDIFNRKKST